MLWDGVFLAFLPTPTNPPTPHTAPTNCWRSRVAVFRFELELGPGHQRIELGDQVTYFLGVSCMKLTCNPGSALRSYGRSQVFG